MLSRSRKRLLFIIRKERKVLRIVFKNGEIIKWKGKRFTDYKYDGKCFIVINKKQWVGIYNLDCIAAVEYVK